MVIYQAILQQIVQRVKLQRRSSWNFDKYLEIEAYFNLQQMFKRKLINVTWIKKGEQFQL